MASSRPNKPTNKNRSKKQKKVSIIILSYNGPEYTTQCIDSIQNSDQTYDEIIIIDNGSQPKTIQVLKGFIKGKKNIKLSLQNKNFGFSKGNNIGIKKAKKNNDIILLNNDIKVITKNWITKLKKEIYSLPQAGLLGCRLVNDKNRLLHVGATMFDDNFTGYQIGSLTEKDVNQYNQPHIEQSIVFAMVYIKRNVINKIGNLDEKYFAYYEDTDYCLRAKKAGFNTFCSGTVTLIHYENITSKINQLNFNKVYQRSRKVFLSKWQKQLRDFDISVNWHSLINWYSGYALTSLHIIKELTKNNVNVGYKYLYGHNTPFPLQEKPSSDRYISYYQNKGFVKSNIEVVYGQGDVFRKNTGKYKIGYTMMETTGIPKEWVRQSNLMDEIWVPSTFNKKTFQDSGVKKPIHVMPLGIDIHHFNPKIKPIELFPDHFKFMTCFEWGKRKAPDILLKTFDDLFGNNKKVKLICKVNNNDGSINVREEIKKLNLKNGGKNIVILYNQMLPTYQMACLYRSCQSFVMPTRGEGWGLPIMEAMACGIPTIATNWSSQTDFIDNKIAYPIKVARLIPATAKCPYYKGFKWADPDTDHLKKQMRQVYTNYSSARKKGKIASTFIHQNFSIETITNRVKDRLIKIQSKL
ncbi:glycosyltransferase [Patescibacteria group bacterium]|nr:glycosyltransferase [Patescibacteria group bacterium]MCG2702532.1 glycosyltransferase [Candidatus Parcubacteria bacterium]MBU4265116.1 glycosyltransferase [Patescibacteria group bacterium]MBU4390680.1 glycosyltransferase [Patescibacteria group bacterium]MBU4430755.1 glycosyltransferase [Patescibacteria group bacterium]